MKTTMPSAIMMVEIAVGKFKQTTALNAHVLILHFQQPLPLRQQPQQPQLQPPPLHHQKVVDPLVGPRINGAMTRTTMPNAIGMVELAALMITMDGTPIARIVNVKSAHQLAGMEITIVMMISIPKVVNGMEEIAVVMSTQTTALIVYALILKPKPELAQTDYCYP